MTSVHPRHRLLRSLLDKMQASTATARALSSRATGVKALSFGAQTVEELCALQSSIGGLKLEMESKIEELTRLRQTLANYQTAVHADPPRSS